MVVNYSVNAQLYLDDRVDGHMLVVCGGPYVGQVLDLVGQQLPYSRFSYSISPIFTGIEDMLGYDVSVRGSLEPLRAEDVLVAKSVANGDTKGLVVGIQSTYGLVGQRGLLKTVARPLYEDTDVVPLK